VTTFTRGSELDVGDVSMAAGRALDERTEQTNVEIPRLKAENAALKTELAALGELTGALLGRAR
jgi:hypothetical protein